MCSALRSAARSCLRHPQLRLAVSNRPSRPIVVIRSMFSGPGAEELRQSSCAAAGVCSRETPRVEPAQLQQLLQAIPAWHVSSDGQQLHRSFTAKNFMAAIKFFNKVAEVAESEGHHPDLHLRNYREVEVNVYTHAVGGLTMPDFVLAAKLDEVEVDYSPKWLKQQQEAMAQQQVQQPTSSAAQ